MALTIETLRAVIRGPARPAVGGRGVTRWFYTTDDAHAALTGAGYFNAATGMLGKGDVIEAATTLAGTPELRLYIVTSATGAAAVTLAQVTNA